MQPHLRKCFENITQVGSWAKGSGALRAPSQGEYLFSHSKSFQQGMSSQAFRDISGACGRRVSCLNSGLGSSCSQLIQGCPGPPVIHWCWLG